MSGILAFIAAAGPILAQIQTLAPTAVAAVQIVKWIYDTVNACVTESRDPTGEEWLQLIQHRDAAIAAAKPRNS